MEKKNWRFELEIRGAERELLEMFLNLITIVIQACGGTVSGGYSEVDDE